MPHLLHLSEDILMGREFAIQTEEFLLLLSQLLYYGISTLSARFKKLDEMMIQRNARICMVVEGEDHGSLTLISTLLRFAGSILDKARGLRPDEWGRANRALPL